MCPLRLFHYRFMIVCCTFSSLCYYTFIHAYIVIHNEAGVTSHYFSLLLVFYVSPPLLIDRFYWVYWYLFMAIGVDLYLGVLLMYWVYLTSISCISYLPVLDAYSLIAYLNDIVHLLFSHKNRDGVNHLLFLSLLRYVFR